MNKKLVKLLDGWEKLLNIETFFGRKREKDGEFVPPAFGFMDLRLTDWGVDGDDLALRLEPWLHIYGLDSEYIKFSSLKFLKADVLEKRIEKVIRVAFGDGSIEFKREDVNLSFVYTVIFY